MPSWSRPASLIQQKRFSLIPKAFLTWVIIPAIPVAACFMIGAQNLSLPVAMLLTIALVLPLGPLLYRVVFQPIATAPVLVLLMVAVALHFAITGLALLYFGPGGLAHAGVRERRRDASAAGRSRSN